MNNITKISDITYQDIADYIRLSEVSQDDQNYLTTLRNISIDYISKYTGIANDDLDNYTDLIIVVFVLCQSMYDDRTMYVDNSNLNKDFRTSIKLFINSSLLTKQYFNLILLYKFLYFLNSPLRNNIFNVNL